MKFLKSEGKSDQKSTFDFVAQKISKYFNLQDKDFDQAVNLLEKKYFIEKANNLLVYVP